MNHATPSIRQLQRSAFQSSLQGVHVDLFTLRGTDGAHINICNYGARIVQIVMPNKQGVIGDVALGFNDLASLLRPSPKGVPSMGAFIGRYANRIADAHFSLNEKNYHLSKNDGEHCIHGGAGGSRYAVFAAKQTASNQLELRHIFTPMKDGFPAYLQLLLSYTLHTDNALHIAWQATALDAPTLASFTSHVFFNLGMHNTIATHRVQLNAAHYLPLTPRHVPTGELALVTDTPFDFRRSTVLGQGLHSAHPQIGLCGGYDHHFAVDDWSGKLKLIATVKEPSSGRMLRVSSTEPGVQLFTANGLDAARCGFNRHSALCLEPSYFPDSPNQAHFPSTRIDAGQTRHGEIVYAFR